MLQFIIWDISPEIVTIGPLTLRWYGILFALGFIVGQYLLTWMFKQEGRDEKEVDIITIYMVLATVLGARLGHCLFYEPDIYLADPIKILYIWEGGLASHGATIGILFAIWLYSRKYKVNYLYVLDRIVITIALAAFFIRMGNLMNSEIIGKPADTPISFVFINNTTEALKSNKDLKDRIKSIDVSGIDKDSTLKDGTPLVGLRYTVTMKTYDDTDLASLVNMKFNKIIANSYEAPMHIFFSEVIPVKELESKGNTKTFYFDIYGVPRHPSQLYESLSSLLLFGLLLFLYVRKNGKIEYGLIFSLFVIWIFGLRFIYEFLKENQVAFEDNLTLNMGQLLSVPMIIIGFIVLWMSLSGRTGYDKLKH